MAERSRHELENQVTIAKIMARKFWTALSVRVDVAAAVAFRDHELLPDARRIVDTAFDAAEIVWEKHRVLVEPCRRIIGADVAGTATYPFSMHSGPDQAEMYLAVYPGGETRNISADTYAKQQGRTGRSAGHPDLTLDDYRALPALGANPEQVYRQGDNRLLLTRGEDGRWRLAVVKVTVRGELYLVSYRWANARTIRQLLATAVEVEL